MQRMIGPVILLIATLAVGAVFLARQPSSREVRSVDRVDLLWEGQILTNGVLRKFRKRIIQLEKRRCSNVR